MHGILMFAHNNGLFDYGKMAYASSLLAKARIKVPVSLVTDDDTWKQLSKDYPSAEKHFDRIIPVENNKANVRRFRMADGSHKEADYLNTTRLRAYELSPYEETLLIDSDVLVLDDALCGIWGSDAPIRINRGIAEMVKYNTKPFTHKLSMSGIDVMWATITYFRKCADAADFFKMVSYVIDNYHYYGLLYGFSTNIFRVDFAVTIVAHILSGYNKDTSMIVDDLPNPNTLFAWDEDILVKFDNNIATFIASDQHNKMPININQTVHCLNKDSMMAHTDGIIRTYG
jgi:hypothetical protein